MSGISTKAALELIPGVLGKVLGVSETALEVCKWGESKGVSGDLPPSRVATGVDLAGLGRVFRPDLVIEGIGKRFVVKWRGSGGTAQILLAVRQLARDWPTGVVPLLVVPFMGDTGRELCAAEGISWCDLSGNAFVQGPGMLVRLEGRPNKYRQRGRPASVFAPKSARITRALLLEPERFFTQKELADETGLDAGFVSRIVRQLDNAALVKREQRKVWAPTPADLLAAWSDAYEFSRHAIVQGFVPALSGETLLAKTTEALNETGVRYYTTGYGAAKLLSGYTDFSHVCYYLEEPLTEAEKGAMHFRESDNIYGTVEESNVWFVTPNDAGIMQGAVDVDGVMCTSAVQVYLDLQGLPGGTPRAAEMVRVRCMDY